MNITHYRERARAAATDAAPRSWYRIRNAAQDVDEPVVIDLYDEIDPFWGISAADFVADLRQVDSKAIDLHINSPGGSVYDGIAIMNALRQHPATVTATVDGLAASAAGFIAVGCDELVMAENSELMIHNAWGLVIGDADDMTKMAADLQRSNTNIASIYQRKAGGDVADWLAAMKDETWYSADEAVECGLADRVAKASKAKPAGKAAWDLSMYNFAGRANAPGPRRTSSAKRAEATPNRKERPMATLDEGLRTLLGVSADADDGALLAKVKAALTERDEALEEATKPAPVAKMPDGVVAVDAAMFAELKAQAERGAAAAARQEDDDRARLLDDAIRAGKIAPASRDAYAKVLAKDLEGGRALLNSLAAGVVPVVGSEIGHSQVGEFNPTDEDMARLGSTFAAITGEEWKA